MIVLQIASEQENLEVVKDIVKFKLYPKIVSQPYHGGGLGILSQSCVLELLWEPFKQLDTKLTFIY